MSQQEEQAKPKKSTRLKKILDSLFLVALCAIYSFFAFYGLGDMEAPQTFFRFEKNDTIAIVLDKEVSNPDVVFYTGITKNDFKFAFASAKSCNCRLNNNELFKEDVSAYKNINISGPFRWEHHVITDEKINVILMRNSSDREIDFGEIAVFDGNERREVSFFRYEGEYLINDDNLALLQDEKELVTRDISAMNSSYFDELYFAQTAYQYATSQYGYETVHPPLGKILQSIPIALTGKMTPFTWRFMGTFTGVIIIIATYFLAKEIFSKTSFAKVAAILVSLSGLHLTQTRLGTVDSYLCLFTILSFLFMVKFYKTQGKFRHFLLSGLFFGCAFTVKWTGAFAGIGLLLIFIAYLIKNKKWNLDKTVKENIFSKEILKWFLRGLLCFIIVPGIIYNSCYLLFPNTTHAYNLNDVSKQSLDLYLYHKDETTPHPYSSKWYTWPIMLVPMCYAYNVNNNTQIYLMGNYVIAYVSILALLITAWFAFKRRDMQSSIIIGAWLGLWLPYALIGRTMFLYHYLPASIFAILAIVNLFFQMPTIRKAIPFYLTAALISFIICYPSMAGV